jgi:hypothetical protein
MLWHILCLPVAHGIMFRLVKNCKSRIASQELQVKNCKSRIASQELQVKNCKSRIAKKSLLDSLDIFSRGLMNERIFSLVILNILIKIRGRERAQVYFNIIKFQVLFILY